MTGFVDALGLRRYALYIFDYGAQRSAARSRAADPVFRYARFPPER